MSRPASASKAAALEDFRRGDQVPAICERYGVSPATAHRWRREATGVTRRKGERGPDVGERALHEDGKTARILELLAGELTPAEVAQLVGVSARAVRQVRARFAKQT